MTTPRALFFGYGDVGHATLSLLLERGVTIAGVFTHEDSPAETHWFPSVAKLAASRNVPVFTPESLKGVEWEERVHALRPGLAVSMYYRSMIPMRLLNLAPLGAFNMHGSYLPRYRGRAPLNWAIINGENHTGVSLHVMVKEADAGDVVDQQKIPIGPDEAVSAVLPRVREAAVKVLSRQLDALLDGRAPRTPQDHTQATYFGKRTPEDGRLDWNRTSREVFNLVRAIGRPFPGAFTDVERNGATARLMVWAGCLRENAVQSTTPETIISLSPLTISCKIGAFEITESEWLVLPPASTSLAKPPLLRAGEPLSHA